VVGGFDAESTRLGAEFYGTYLGAEIKRMESLEAAELVKLAGMLYRDVNIALANELAAYAEAAGVDFGAVREAANDREEPDLLIPGIGVGGHCTPVYPYFLIHDGARRNAPQRLAEEARRINDQQPARNVERLIQAWGPIAGKRVHILGLGFRPDVKVDIFSTAYPLRDALVARGAIVTIEDPCYSAEELRAMGFAAARAGSDALDAAMLNTAHTAFKHPDFAQWRASGIEALVDGRDFWEPQTVRDAGIVYLGVGRG
jgi:nucleotide sugar dehydrogenase